MRPVISVDEMLGLADTDEVTSEGTGAKTNGAGGDPVIKSLDAIRETDFAPVQWAVRHLFPTGTTVLAGRPKMGKSWLCLQAAIAVRLGVPMWSGLPPEQSGGVVYLALEDNERRMKSRSKAIHPDGKLPVDIVMEWPKWDPKDGGGPAISALVGYLVRNPGCRLVMIDTLVKFRGANNSKDIAQADYQIGATLTRIAARFDVAIVIVAHSRKLEDPHDPFADLMGTTGIAAGVDTVAVLRRTRGNPKATLHVGGRDIEDDRPIKVRWDPIATRWQWEGHDEGNEISDESQEVLDILGDRRMWPKDVHVALMAADKQVSLEATQKRLRRMESRGEVVWTRARGYGSRRYWEHCAKPLEGGQDAD